MSKFNTIIFVSAFLTERVESFAEAIYLCSGNRPHLITLIPPGPDTTLDNFESHRTVKILDLCTTLTTFQPCIVHNFTKVMDITTLELLKAGIPFHYDYKDIFFHHWIVDYPERETHRLLWKAILERRIPISYRDGQARRATSFLGRDQFEGYYVPEFVTVEQHAENKKVREPYPGLNRKKDVVFIGNFSLETVTPEQAGLGQLPIATTLTSQGIKYTMFPRQTSARSADDFSLYYQLASSTDLFVMNSTLPRKDLHKQLRFFGWGAILLPISHFNSLASKTFAQLPFHGLPGRLADYLGSGLPVLVSGPDWPELNDLVESYGVGLNLYTDDLFELSSIISHVDYSSLLKNVRSFVSDFLSPHKAGSVILTAYETYDY